MEIICLLQNILILEKLFVLLHSTILCRKINSLQTIMSALQRYCNKDWGDLYEEDKQTNEDALQYPDDLYLLATHKTCKGKIYIITERISENAGDKCNYSMFS